jgi:tRNA(Ile)-lysidine synthase
MPRQAQRGGVIWIRPWLARPRAELQAYVDRHDLRHVEDDSNADPRHARNRLRLQVWPVISAGHDAAADALVQVARHAQEAKACLQALAEIDLARAVRDDGLDIVALHESTPPRRANALRHWLGATVGQPPAASLLQRLATQLDVSRALSWPIDGEHELRLYRGVLRVARVDACAGRVAPVAPAVREQRMQVTAPGVYPLPGWGGVLVVELAGADAATAGVAAFVDLAQLVQVELRARSGAERFQLGLCRPARSLKKQFQALAVPEGARGGPVLWIGERLLFVPGLGVDASWHEAARRAAQPCTLAWRSLVVPMLQRGG